MLNKANLRPARSVTEPAGIAPKNAPTATRDPIHDPSSCVTGKVELGDCNWGSAGAVQAKTVPTANAVSVAVIK